MMKKRFVRWVAGTMIPAALVIGGAGLPAAAQDKAKAPEAAKSAAAPAKKGEPMQKVYVDNDQARVFEVTFKPGDAATNAARPLRVIHALKGGTLTLHYPDGKKESRVFKTGETQVVQASPVYQPKNEGKSDIVLLVTYVKEPKK